MKSSNYIIAMGVNVCLCLGLWATGCASRNVNPSSAKANTGYADLFIDATVPLCWEVTSVDQANRKLHTLFSDFDPIYGNTLRLAMRPGSYRIQTTYLNHAIVTPAVASIAIKDGEITPIEIQYEPVDRVLVKDSGEILKRTVRGVMRTQDVTMSATMTYNLSANVRKPIAYRPKEQTPYFKARLEGGASD